MLFHSFTLGLLLYCTSTASLVKTMFIGQSQQTVTETGSYMLEGFKERHVFTVGLAVA